jgi:ElaB/YqjD/DUF883 family membrane-anchored ribosome-binding protein
MTGTELNMQALQQLAEVRGQLSTITQLLQQNAKHTDQRIDDLRRSIEDRMDMQESRLDNLEKNERGTAIRTAAVAAVTSTIVAAGMAIARGFKP